MNALQRLTPALVNEDPEFKLAARMWHGDVVFASGDDALRMTVRDGRVTEVVPSAAGAAAQVRIAATEDVWEQMLRPAPPPFYHDLFGAVARHGVVLAGEPTDVFPYYPALRRVIELLRSATGEANGAVR